MCISGNRNCLMEKLLPLKRQEGLQLLLLSPLCEIPLLSLTKGSHEKVDIGLRLLGVSMMERMYWLRPRENCVKSQVWFQMIGNYIRHFLCEER